MSGCGPYRTSGNSGLNRFTVIVSPISDEVRRRQFCLGCLLKKKPPKWRFQVTWAHGVFYTRDGYFSWVEMLSNLAFRVVPIAFTVAIITTEMPAAIRPYSIAVAPESSFRNATTLDI